MNISSDIDRASTAFLRQFHSVYAKFYNLNDEVLHHLFRSYTSSFYGIETWYNALANRNIHKMSICYHKAVKRVARLNVWNSNHVACDIVNVSIFTHLLAKRAICFYFSLIKSQSPCVSPYIYYFRYNSFIKSSLAVYFQDKYNVTLDNPLCTLISRIKYVQIHKPRRR